MCNYSSWDYDTAAAAIFRLLYTFYLAMYIYTTHYTCSTSSHNIIHVVRPPQHWLFPHADVFPFSIVHTNTSHACWPTTLAVCSYM